MPGTNEAAGGKGSSLRAANQSKAGTGRDDNPRHPVPEATKEASRARNESTPEASTSAVAAEEEGQRQGSSPPEVTGFASPAADGAAAAAAKTAAAARDSEAEDGSATQHSATPKKEEHQHQFQAQQQPVGDDWYTEGGARGAGEVEDAGSRTAREITRLWVRAVGWLCCPSHSELWPHMIDVGIIGALNTWVHFEKKEESDHTLRCGSFGASPKIRVGNQRFTRGSENNGKPRGGGGGGGGRRRNNEIITKERGLIYHRSAP